VPLRGRTAARGGRAVRTPLRPLSLPAGRPLEDDQLVAFLNHPVDQLRLWARALYSREAQAELFSERPKDKIYCVPRRFDLATLFAVSTAFALLFGLFGQLGSTPWQLLLLFVYISGVGLAQALVFGGRAPRAASVFAGAVLMSGYLALLVPGNNYLAAVAAFLFSSLFTGALGYLTGAVIGGVFLVADLLRNWLEQRARLKAEAVRNMQSANPVG
jgi:hypothetical protein